MDWHAHSLQVFSLFLDTLNELILTHKADLSDWLYVLLTRLLNKLGGDLLGSIQNKIHKSLAVVRWVLIFHSLQSSVLLREIISALERDKLLEFVDVTVDCISWCFSRSNTSCTLKLMYKTWGSCAYSSFEFQYHFDNTTY